MRWHSFRANQLNCFEFRGGGFERFANPFEFDRLSGWFLDKFLGRGLKFIAEPTPVQSCWHDYQQHRTNGRMELVRYLFWRRNNRVFDDPGTHLSSAWYDAFFTRSGNPLGSRPMVEASGK